MHGSEENKRNKAEGEADKRWKVDLSTEYCLDAHKVLELKSKTMWLTASMILKGTKK